MTLTLWRSQWLAERLKETWMPFLWQGFCDEDQSEEARRYPPGASTCVKCQAAHRGRHQDLSSLHSCRQVVRTMNTLAFHSTRYHPNEGCTFTPWIMKDSEINWTLDITQIRNAWRTVTWRTICTSSTLVQSRWQTLRFQCEIWESRGSWGSR